MKRANRSRSDQPQWPSAMIWYRAAVEVDLPWDAWGGDVLDAAKLCDVRTGLKAALLGPSSCSA